MHGPKFVLAAMAIGLMFAPLASANPPEHAACHDAPNGCPSDDAGAEEPAPESGEARASPLPPLPPYCTWLIVRYPNPYFEPDCLLP